MRKFGSTCLAMSVALGGVSPPSHALATFPGENREIAFIRFPPGSGTPTSMRTVFRTERPGACSLLEIRVSTGNGRRTARRSRFMLSAVKSADRAASSARREWCDAANEHSRQVGVRSDLLPGRRADRLRSLARLGSRRFEVRSVPHEERWIGNPATHRPAKPERVHENVEIDARVISSKVSARCITAA